MAIALTQNRRDRKSQRRSDRSGQEEAFNNARDDEIRRQEELRRQEMQRDVFQTTEGQGISETANISLGFDEDEDDLFESMTGLIV